MKGKRLVVAVALIPSLGFAAQNEVDAATYRGYAVYQDECARCHGEDATGNARAPNLLRSVTRLSRQQMQDVIVNGRKPGATRPAMPPFGLTEDVTEALDGIVDYLKLRAAGALPPGPPARTGS